MHGRKLLRFTIGFLFLTRKMIIFVSKEWREVRAQGCLDGILCIYPEAESKMPMDKEFRSRAGSAPIVQFVLGAFAMIGALVFL